MSTVKKINHLSVDDYLEGEKHSGVRHEYVKGKVYAMVGTSKRHNLLAFGLASSIRSHLRGSPCRVFISDVKVRVDDVFYYPDILVTCAKIDIDSYYETQPVLIIEVLSESTEARDRFEKRLAYQTLDSLKEYVLVAQNEVEVEIHRRVADGWEVEIYGQGEIAEFRSIRVAKPVDEIYEEVLGPG